MPQVILWLADVAHALTPPAASLHVTLLFKGICASSPGQSFQLSGVGRTCPQLLFQVICAC